MEVFTVWGANKATSAGMSGVDFEICHIVNGNVTRLTWTVINELRIDKVIG